MAQTDSGGGVAPTPPTPKQTSGSGGGAAAVVRSSVGAAAGANWGPESGDAFGHHSLRDIKRGQGQSAVKSAAYITGDSIFDARLGLTFGRPEKSGRVLAVGTVGPAGSSWTAGDLWSAAEKAETKSNARTGQTREVALPIELDEAAHKRLLNGFALWHRDTYGTAATWALHAPSGHGDKRNTHGHINTTTRAVGMDAEGRPQFGAKVRALGGNREQVATEIERGRAEWARRVNAELEKAGSRRRLDHRSHARRAEAGDGPALEASAHKGARRAAKERRDPAAAKAARAAEAARRERNAATAAAWKEGGRAAENVVKIAAEVAQGPDEREAAAAARWAEKQAREWEAWRRKQEQEDNEGQDRDGPSR